MGAAEQTLERDLDCRGMQCPKPIMQLAGTVGTLGGQPAILRVQADDPAFVEDLRAWARATRSVVATERHQGGVFHAVVLVHGATVPASSTALEDALPDLMPPRPSGATPPERLESAVVPRLALDLRGKQCPAPVMEIAKAWRELGTGARALSVLADDPAFPGDLRVWCNAAKAELLELEEDRGTFRAEVVYRDAGVPLAAVTRDALPGPGAGPGRPATLTSPRPVGEGSGPVAAPQTIVLDLRGKQCPVPVMEVAKAARQAAGTPTVIRVLADDPAFPKDLEAWCRSANAALGSVRQSQGVYEGVVLLGGATLASVPSAPVLPLPTAPKGPPAPPPVTASTPRPDPWASSVTAAIPRVRTLTGSSWAAPMDLDVDLGELDSGLAVARLTEAQLQLAATGGRILARSSAPALLGEVVSWCTLMRCKLEGIHTDAQGLRAEIRVEARPGALGASHLMVLPPPVAAAVGTALVARGGASASQCAERENQATLLLFHDDFDSAMAAFLVASGAVAQGMKVKIFFSFWAVALLRAKKSRRANPEGYFSPHRPSFIQRLMRRLLPRGARQAKLSKMNMAGVGSGMMRGIMRKQNIMSLEAMLNQCAELGVQYQVCTMSMNLMGLEPRDLSEFPGLEYLGVGAFVEEAKRSCLSMVF